MPTKTEIAKPPPCTARSRRGQLNYHKGRVAEEQIAAHYRRAGYIVRDMRWRGTAGEIDLVVETATDVVFVEVKSSSTLDSALSMVTPEKAARVWQAASEYLATLATGLATCARIDVACLDAKGEISILENAIGH